MQAPPAQVPTQVVMTLPKVPSALHSRTLSPSHAGPGGMHCTQPRISSQATPAPCPAAQSVRRVHVPSTHCCHTLPAQRVAFPKHSEPMCPVGPQLEPTSHSTTDAKG